MTLDINNIQICQSCGKPLKLPEEFGKNADGSLNKDYCGFCYANGNLTYPHIKMDQMIEISGVLMAALMDIPENEAKEKAKIAIPKLKRWQKK